MLKKYEAIICLPGYLCMSVNYSVVWVKYDGWVDGIFCWRDLLKALSINTISGRIWVVTDSCQHSEIISLGLHIYNFGGSGGCLFNLLLSSSSVYYLGWYYFLIRESLSLEVCIKTFFLINDLISLEVSLAI